MCVCVHTHTHTHCHFEETVTLPWWPVEGTRTTDRDAGSLLRASCLPVFTPLTGRALCASLEWLLPSTGRVAHDVDDSEETMGTRGLQRGHKDKQYSVIDGKAETQQREAGVAAPGDGLHHRRPSLRASTSILCVWHPCRSTPRQLSPAHIPKSGVWGGPSSCEGTVSASNQLQMARPACLSTGHTFSGLFFSLFQRLILNKNSVLSFLLCLPLGGHLAKHKDAYYKGTLLASPS